MSAFVAGKQKHPRQDERAKHIIIDWLSCRRVFVLDMFWMMCGCSLVEFGIVFGYCLICFGLLLDESGKMFGYVLYMFFICLGCWLDEVGMFLDILNILF